MQNFTKLSAAVHELSCSSVQFISFALFYLFIYLFIYFLLCNEQSRQTREINNGEVEQKYSARAFIRRRRHTVDMERLKRMRRN